MQGVPVASVFSFFVCARQPRDVPVSPPFFIVRTPIRDGMAVVWFRFTQRQYIQGMGGGDVNFVFQTAFLVVLFGRHLNPGDVNFDHVFGTLEYTNPCYFNATSTNKRDDGVC